MATEVACPQCGGHLSLLPEVRVAACDRCEWAVEVPVKQKSEREQLTDRIAEYISRRYETFNAPYGVLPSLERLPHGGAVRTITFGCARTLDATLNIWGPTNITLRASTGEERVFHSEDAVYAWLSTYDDGERSCPNCHDSYNVDAGCSCKGN